MNTNTDALGSQSVETLTSTLDTESGDQLALTVLILMWSLETRHPLCPVSLVTDLSTRA